MKTSKKAIRAQVKALRSEAGTIRAQWMVRGVVEGEFEKVEALEYQAWTLDPDKVVPQVDSLIK